MSDIRTIDVRLSEDEAAALRYAEQLAERVAERFGEKGNHDAAQHARTHEAHLEAMRAQAASGGGLLAASTTHVYALRYAGGLASVDAAKRAALGDAPGAVVAKRHAGRLEQLTTRVANAYFGGRA